MTVFSIHHPLPSLSLKLTCVKVSPCLNAHRLQLLDEAVQLRVVLAVKILRVQVGCEVEEAAQSAAVVLKGSKHRGRERRIAEVVASIPTIQPMDLLHTLHNAVGKEACSELHKNLIQYEASSGEAHENDGQSIVVVANIIIYEYR